VGRWWLSRIIKKIKDKKPLEGISEILLFVSFVGFHKMNIPLKRFLRDFPANAQKQSFWRARKDYNFSERISIEPSTSTFLNCAQKSEIFGASRKKALRYQGGALPLSHRGNKPLFLRN